MQMVFSCSVAYILHCQAFQVVLDVSLSYLASMVTIHSWIQGTCSRERLPSRKKTTF